MEKDDEFEDSISTKGGFSDTFCTVLLKASNELKVCKVVCQHYIIKHWTITMLLMHDQVFLNRYYCLGLMF